jgi:hypothetical protein
VGENYGSQHALGLSATLKTTANDAVDQLSGLASSHHSNQHRLSAVLQ